MTIVLNNKKKLEKGLKEHFETNEWLKDLFNNAHDLIQIVHLDGTLLYVNNSWSKLLGYQEEEITGKSLYSFIKEEDQLRYRQYRQHILDGNNADKEIIFKLKKKSGEIVIVEGLISAKYINGQCVYTRGIFRDVTRRLENETLLKKYNRTLRENENNLKQLLTHAPDAVIVINQESNITFWNPKATAIFGWTEEQVLNKPLSDTIIPLQHRQAHQQGMKRFLSTGVAHVLNKSIEITALHKTGKEFYVSLTISQTIQGGKLAFIAFLRDITEQKNNQVELEQKKEELERSNINLQEFAYAASHDLKEPVRKIHIFSDLLKERLKEKLLKEDLNWFDKMDKAAKRMSSLIDDLLTFSSVNRGGGILEEVYLKDKVQEVLEDLELEKEEKNATILVDKLPVIKGHKRQLQQLFHNLIMNALKYSKEGVQPIIYIHSTIINGSETPLQLSIDEQYKQYYLIEVKDNGIGFEQADAERIFNVFTRLHGNNKYLGSGVGLSIVQKVVENHNGFIWAESKPGVGSTFNMLFPVN